MHCGWMPREETKLVAYEGPAFMNGVDLAAIGICPGWLAHQEPVAEIARAHWALEKRVLPMYLPRSDKFILDGVAELSRASDRFQVEQLRTMKERA
jgi:hypothetical protein